MEPDKLPIGHVITGGKLLSLFDEGVVLEVSKREGAKTTLKMTYMGISMGSVYYIAGSWGGKWIVL